MKFADVTAWVEEHPTESIVIGAGGVIAILWLLGYFGSSSSSSSGSSSLASAYYAAEAQQAVVGGEIQMNNSDNATQAAVASTQANAAVAINAAQTGAAVTINGQNASAGTTINQSNNDAATAQASIGAGVSSLQSNNQLLATYSNNATTVATNAANNAASIENTHTAYTANMFGTLVNGVIAPELQQFGETAGTVPGLGSFNISGGQAPNISGLRQMGYVSGQTVPGWPGIVIP